jgi:hypothetical protein
LCLYFGLQALLLVKRTSTVSPLVAAVGGNPKGNATAGPTRKAIEEKITAERNTFERTMYGSPV